MMTFDEALLQLRREASWVEYHPSMNLNTLIIGRLEPITHTFMTNVEINLGMRNMDPIVYQWYAQTMPTDYLINTIIMLTNQIRDANI